jgi:hypothetical protein
MAILRVALAFCLMACAVCAQQEGEEIMVTPFSDILGQVLERANSMNQPGAQKQIITHGPQGGFEIQIDFNGDNANEDSQDEGEMMPFPGQRGGPANIFGRMFQRMRQMRERIDDAFQNSKQTMQRGDQGEITTSESPFRSYLRSKVNKKMWTVRKHLVDDCEPELERCPEVVGTIGMVQCLKDQIHELSPECEQELDIAEEELKKKQNKVNKKHSRITREMQRMCEQELPQFCGLPESPRFTLFQRSMRSQDLLDRKLACLVQNLPQLTPDSECHQLVQSVATHWGEFEVKDAKRKELRANLKDKCSQDLVANAKCQKKRCVHGKLKCLSKVADTLSTDCADFVTMRVSVLNAQTSKDAQLKDAHMNCKKVFTDATGVCKEHKDMNDTYSCINDAKKALNECLEESDVTFAAAVMPNIQKKHRHPMSSDDESSSDEEGEASWWKQKERKWTKKLQDLKDRFKKDDASDDEDKQENADDEPPVEVSLADEPLAPKHEEQAQTVQHTQALKEAFSKQNNNKQENKESPALGNSGEVVLADDTNKVADQAMVIAFGALLMLVVVGVLCMIMKRAPQHYELEAMHMTVQGSGTSHDQL